jgi:hypothetical protein
MFLEAGACQIILRSVVISLKDGYRRRRRSLRRFGKGRSAGWTIYIYKLQKTYKGVTVNTVVGGVATSLRMGRLTGMVLVISSECPDELWFEWIVYVSRLVGL